MRRPLAIALLGILLSAANGHAQEITTCRNPVGKAFYHFNGMNDKSGSGWIDDGIKNGVTTLVRTNDGSPDILYVDIRGKPISMTQEGAAVRVLRFDEDQITIIVVYEGATTEIYSFFREKDGKSRFTVLTNKTGKAAAFPKSSVMVGDCDPIRFDLLTARKP